MGRLVEVIDFHKANSGVGAFAAQDRRVFAVVGGQGRDDSRLEIVRRATRTKTWAGPVSGTGTSASCNGVPICIRRTAFMDQQSLIRNADNSTADDRASNSSGLARAVF